MLPVLVAALCGTSSPANQTLVPWDSAVGESSLAHLPRSGAGERPLGAQRRPPPTPAALTRLPLHQVATQCCHDTSTRAPARRSLVNADCGGNDPANAHDGRIGAGALPTFAHGAHDCRGSCPHASVANHAPGCGHHRCVCLDHRIRRCRAQCCPISDATVSSRTVTGLFESNTTRHTPTARCHSAQLRTTGTAMARWPSRNRHRRRHRCRNSRTCSWRRPLRRRSCGCAHRQHRSHQRTREHFSTCSRRGDCWSRGDARTSHRKPWQWRPLRTTLSPSWRQRWGLVSEPLSGTAYLAAVTSLG